MCLSEKRGRGRPRKPTEPPNRWYESDIGYDELRKLQGAIACNLDDVSEDTARALAHIAASYAPLAQLRRDAPLKNPRRGNRPHIEVAVLMRECADLYEQETGKIAKSELAKIGGWSEEAGQTHPILDRTNAVLSALGVPCHSSLRRQARNAMEIKRQTIK